MRSFSLIFAALLFAAVQADDSGAPAAGNATNATGPAPAKANAAALNSLDKATLAAAPALIFAAVYM